MSKSDWLRERVYVCWAKNKEFTQEKKKKMKWNQMSLKASEAEEQ